MPQLAKRDLEMICDSTESHWHSFHNQQLFQTHVALDQGFAIEGFIRCALASQPIAIRGDPSTIRSYLYAADLAVWTWTILSRAAPLRPYNVGSDKAISLGALVESSQPVCKG